MKKKNYRLQLILVMLLIVSCNGKKGSMSWSDEKAMLKALEWQETNRIWAIRPTDWTNGVYYLGVCKAHEVTDDDEFFDALIDMGERNRWQSSDRYYHANDLAICSSYLYLKSMNVEEADLTATGNIIKDHLDKSHKWKNGNVDTNQPILWWWCDALFMSPPAITMYAKITRDKSYLDKMHVYFKESYELLYDKEKKLFAQDLRYVSNKTGTDLYEENSGKIFRSRGNGWVLGGLALILQNMPEDYEHRKFYLDLFKEMSERIVAIQHKDGLWRTNLLSPESYEHGEVSASGLFTFALVWGMNQGILDKKKYKSAVKKAWTALRACQKEDGMIGWVQDVGDSPIPENERSWQNYGTGAFLLAGSEMIKLLDEGKADPVLN